MRKPTDDQIKGKLFELAELVLDDALRADTPPTLRLESLKQVSALYLGNVRVTKHLKEDDSFSGPTMESLRQQITNVKE